MEDHELHHLAYGYSVASAYTQFTVHHRVYAQHIAYCRPSINTDGHPVPAEHRNVQRKGVNGCPRKTKITLSQVSAENCNLKMNTY